LLTVEEKTDDIIKVFRIAYVSMATLHYYNNSSPIDDRGLCRGLQGDAQAVLVEGQSHHWFQAELSVAGIIYDWLVKKGISNT